MAASKQTQQLVARLDRIAELLLSPDVTGRMLQAQAVAASISQGAPNGAVAGLALQLVAALGAIAQYPHVPEYMVSLETVLRHLREALMATDRDES